MHYQREAPRFLSALVLIGGAVFVVLHAVSDIGITGLLGAKLVGSYGPLHDRGVAFTLYWLTFAIDSVGDVFASLFLLATGLLVLRSAALPRWLSWVAFVAGALFFVHGFTLGGVVASFGVVIDIVGFLLFLFFVAASSAIGLFREGAVQRPV
jgi:hypothetical protein